MSEQVKTVIQSERFMPLVKELLRPMVAGRGDMTPREVAAAIETFLILYGAAQRKDKETFIKDLTAGLNENWDIVVGTFAPVIKKAKP